ncbi:MAG: AAA family ATPase [Pseudoalteromonas sp.]|uniref:DnaB-like helicase C-terminal domain-containing protein n=1 Tax=Pseudoalteromonas sp. TaxID=53249 RepID=UPI001DD3DAE0|nr:DnaB-like helicase C-terminal domain-containing protein [Pseudoalteromonas sp.]NRA76914.1 AAA family ATPase [Pseudoalteromonas sp.]
MLTETAKKIYTFLESTGEKIHGSDESKEYNIDCFLCTDKRHRLGINKTTEKWHCFNCHSGGNTLKNLEWAFKNRKKVKNNDTIKKTEQEIKCTIPQDFHKKYFKEIFNTKENDCAKYLINERGFSQEAIKHFELGFRWEFKSRRGNYDAGDHLVIPYIKEGKCVNVKYRKLKPESKKDKWRREEGGVSSLYNDAVIDDFNYNEIIIAESELDAISIWEMGFKNVIGLTTGAGGFKNKPEWVDRLERFDRVYLVLDGDEAGQEGARQLATMLGLGRCLNVLLPEDAKDPNDYLLNKKYTSDDFIDLLAHGEQFEVRNVTTLRQQHKKFYHEKFVTGEREKSSKYNTPWKPVNRIIGPLNDGYLFVLGGKPKAGKTSIAMDMMKHWAKQGHNCGIYSCEMRGERLHDKWLMSEPHRFPSKEGKGIDFMDKLSYHRACLRLPSNNLHIFNPTVQNDILIDGVVENSEAMIKRYGLKILIVDNLHYLCRGGDENAMVSEATQKLKLLAERLDVMIVLIVHPKKTNTNKQLKPEDLKGSSSIIQDADVIWLQHRPFDNDDMKEDDVKVGYAKHDPMSFKTDISITGRFTEGGRTFLYFSGAYSTFKCDGIGYETILNEFGKNGKRSKRKKRAGL